MTEVVSLLFDISVWIFVLTSMLGMGLILTLRRILIPMRKVSLILKSLLANFIIVPLFAFGLTRVIGLDQQLTIGLIILGVTSGAPLLAKYAQLARGNLGFTLGLMVLLMVVTIIYVPLVLPLMIPDVQVDIWGLVRSLVLTMLIPLATGLFIRARYESIARTLAPYMSRISTFALIAEIIFGFILILDDLPDVFGSGAILALVLFITGNLIIGWLLGRSKRDTRIVVALGTAQRNVAAAMLIIVQNFTESKVLLMVLIGLVLMLGINTLFAFVSGKRHRAKELKSKSA